MKDFIFIVKVLAVVLICGVSVLGYTLVVQPIAYILGIETD